MSAATPKPHLPLSVDDDSGWPIILDAYGEYIARVATKSEAAFIVTACNNHESLVAAINKTVIELNGAGPDSSKEFHRLAINSALNILGAALSARGTEK